MLRSPNSVDFISFLKQPNGLHSVPGRPVILYYMFYILCFYTENISAFLDFQIKSIASKVKSYIKHNNFLRKLQNLPKLPGDATLCTADSLYLELARDQEISLR